MAICGHLRGGQSKHTLPLTFIFFDYGGRYIEESIKLDHTKFKLVPQVNPFLEDFMDQGAHADAGESSGVGQLSGLARLVGHL